MSTTPMVTGSPPRPPPPPLPPLGSLDDSGSWDKVQTAAAGRSHTLMSDDDSESNQGKGGDGDDDHREPAAGGKSKKRGRARLAPASQDDDEGAVEDATEGDAAEGDAAEGDAAEGCAPSDDEGDDFGGHETWKDFMLRRSLKEADLFAATYQLTTEASHVRVFHVDRTSDGDDTTGEMQRAAMAGLLVRVLRFGMSKPVFLTFSVQETGGAATFANRFKDVLRAGDVILFASVDRLTREGRVVFEAFVATCTAIGVLVGVFLLGDANWRVVMPAAEGGKATIRLLSFLNAQAISNSTAPPLTVTASGPVADDAAAMAQAAVEADEAKQVLTMYQHHSAVLDHKLGFVRAVERDAGNLPPYVDVARRACQALVTRSGATHTALVSRTSVGTAASALEGQHEVLKALLAPADDDAAGLAYAFGDLALVDLSEQSANKEPFIGRVEAEWQQLREGGGGGGSGGGDAAAAASALGAVFAASSDRVARCPGLADYSGGVKIYAFAGVHELNATAVREAIAQRQGGSAAAVLLGEAFDDDRLERDHNLLVADWLRLLLDGHSTERVAPLLVSLTHCGDEVRKANNAYAADVLGARRYLAGKAPHTRLGMTAPAVVCEAVSAATRQACNLARLASAAADARAEADAQLRRSQTRARAHDTATLLDQVARDRARTAMGKLAGVQRQKKEAAEEAELAAAAAENALDQAGLPASSWAAAAAAAAAASAADDDGGALRQLLRSPGQVASADVARAFALGWTARPLAVLRPEAGPGDGGRRAGGG